MSIASAINSVIACMESFIGAEDRTCCAAMISLFIHHNRPPGFCNSVGCGAYGTFAVAYHGV